MKLIKNTLVIIGTLALLTAAAYAIWLRLPAGVSAILWQSPNECFVNCAPAAPPVRYGAYDPQGRLTNEARISVNHIFLSWADDNEVLLAKNMDIAKMERRALFISLEPWPDRAHSKDTLLADVVGGFYDANIKSFCNTLGNYEGEVWLSWGHEMDHDLTERYPWSHKEPADFTAAYRHFVQTCRPYANMVKFIWSPVGNKNTNMYWPGPDVVDMIGVPVYAYPEFDKDVYGSTRTFAQAFGEKYERVKGYGKPVVVVELGVNGDAQYQNWWLSDAKTSYGNFPLLLSVVLFNASDTPGAWGEKYGTPDWHLRDGVALP